MTNPKHPIDDDEIRAISKDAVSRTFDNTPARYKWTPGQKIFAVAVIFVLCMNTFFNFLSQEQNHANHNQNVSDKKQLGCAVAFFLPKGNALGDALRKKYGPCPSNFPLLDTPLPVPATPAPTATPTAVPTTKPAAGAPARTAPETSVKAAPAVPAPTPAAGNNNAAPATTAPAKPTPAPTSSAALIPVGKTTCQLLGLFC